MKYKNRKTNSPPKSVRILSCCCYSGLASFSYRSIFCLRLFNKLLLVQCFVNKSSLLWLCVLFLLLKFSQSFSKRYILSMWIETSSVCVPVFVVFGMVLLYACRLNGAFYVLCYTFTSWWVLNPLLYHWRVDKWIFVCGELISVVFQF